MYGLFHRLQKESPVHRFGPYVIVSRFDGVLSAIRDPTTFSSMTGGSRIAAIESQMLPSDLRTYRAIRSFESLHMVRRDDPDHARLRRTAHRLFKPAAVAGMATALEGITDTLVAAWPARHGEVVDFISEFAYQLPLLATFRLLDVPASTHLSVRTWSEVIVRFRASPTDPGLIRKAVAAIDGFRRLVRDVVEEHRNGVRASPLGSVLLDAHKEGRVSEEELVAMFVLLLFAGHETTTNLLGNGLLAMLSHPVQWRRWRLEPEIRMLAVEEFLRFDTPVQHMPRVAVRDAELSGHPIAAGESLILLLAAANCDPREFDSPDSLKLDREPNRHLGFGFGIHFCLGAGLARLETAIGLGRLADRFPDLKLEPSDLRWRRTTGLRGLTELPIRLP